MTQHQAPVRRDGSRSRQTYTLFAAHGRVYASNVRQKLIDLGSLAETDGRYRYELDGDHATGEGFASAEDALHDIGERVSFFFLDGQFTALGDRRDDVPGLEKAPQLEVTLDELGQGEPAFNLNA